MDLQSMSARGWLRRWAMAGSALVASAALAACGASGSMTKASAGLSAPTASAASAASSGVAEAAAALKGYLKTPTKINISTPLKSPAPRGKTLVELGTSNPQNVEIQHEFATIAKTYGWHYSLIDYDPANNGAFTAALNTALQKHPTFINESGTPLTPSVLAQVKAAHVKLVPIGVYPLAIKAPVIADPDAYESDAEFAQPVADYFISNSDGKGNALVVHVPAYPILDGFTNTLQSVVKSECPGCALKFLNLTLPQIAAGSEGSAIAAALRSDSSAKYLIFDDGGWADGITQALSAAGVSGVKIIGQAPDQNEMAAIRAGTEELWSGFYPQENAMQAFDAMFRTLEGMPVPAAEGIIPTQAITKATIGSSDNWSYPATAQAQYEALWNK